MGKLKLGETRETIWWAYTKMPTHKVMKTLMAIAQSH